MAVYINLWGGPCTGKSTAAARIFGELKKRGYNAELVPEYGKEIAYRQSYTEYKDELLIFAKQYNREQIVENAGVQFIICAFPSAMVMPYMDASRGFLFNSVINAANNLIRVAREVQVYNNLVIDVALQRNFALKDEGKPQEEQLATEKHIKIIETLDTFNDIEYLAASRYIHTRADKLEPVITALVESGALPLATKEDDWFTTEEKQ